eukprot:g15921.t1
MFNQVKAALMKDFFKGFNATIFAYGQTGSGKTWTMMGNRKSPTDPGLTPRLIEMIFNFVETTKKNPELSKHLHFVVEVGYIEIYLESIQDLLDVKNQDLNIREAKGRGIWVDNQTRRRVSTLEEVLQVIDLGDKNRTTGKTNMNEHSSRSHAVFDIVFSQLDKRSGTKLVSSLFLVDLAGSEKQKKTGAEGVRLEQGIAINKSLSALGNVIKALSAKLPHVPFRDSKLTRLLTNALSGNSKTLVVITASPSPYNEEETTETLRFGKRAKTIKTKAVQNREYSIADYKKMVKGLREQVRILTEKNNRLKKAVLIGTSVALPYLPEPKRAAAQKMLDDINAETEDDKRFETALEQTPLQPRGTNLFNFSQTEVATPTDDDWTVADDGLYQSDGYDVKLTQPVLEDGGSSGTSRSLQGDAADERAQPDGGSLGTSRSEQGGDAVKEEAQPEVVDGGGTGTSRSANGGDAVNQGTQPDLVHGGSTGESCSATGGDAGNQAPQPQLVDGGDSFDTSRSVQGGDTANQGDTAIRHLDLLQPNPGSRGRSRKSSSDSLVNLEQLQLGRRRRDSLVSPEDGFEDSPYLIRIAELEKELAEERERVRSLTILMLDKSVAAQTPKVAEDESCILM